jgi:hypothetical protein
MQPVVRELAGLSHRLANPSLQVDHPVGVQQRLEAVDFARVDPALGQQHDIDATGLLAGGDQHAIQQVKIKPLGRRELEEPVRVLRQPFHGPAYRVEVRCSHPQRPRQQKERGVLRPKVPAAMPSGHLGPPHVDTGAEDAGVARKRRSSCRGSADFREHP